jgi:glycosyltransferase involved in cell wall biosynthesis
MTVLLVNKFHYLKGGAERYYLDLAELLRGGGTKVVHLAMKHAENLPAGDGDRFVSEVDYRASMSFGSKMRHAVRSIYNFEAAREARRIARESRPRIAHLHNIYHQLSPSVIRALDGEGVPVVQTLHDYKLICPDYLLITEGKICERCRGSRYYEAVRHRCLLSSRGPSVVAMVEAYLHAWIRSYDRVRLFICPSRFLLEKVASFGIDRKRLVDLPYFLPVDRYTPAADTDGYYVYAGRLSREKGIHTLLEAHARLPKAGRPALRVLGDGPIRPALEERKMALGLDDVSFEGYQSPDRLRKIVARARFVAVPSEWYENYPFAILEAFALARPVLGTRIGGIPELVRDGETGMTAPAFDPDGLAGALAILISDPAKADEMGKAARSWIGSTLDPATHLERLMTVYERALR